MKLAVRPYALAGIVLACAGIVVASPLRPSIPQVEVPATQLTTDTLPFDTGGISTQLEILAPGAAGLDGLGTDIGDIGAGEVPILDGIAPAPLQVDVFLTPEDYASMIDGVVPGPNDLFPAHP